MLSRRRLFETSLGVAALAAMPAQANRIRLRDFRAPWTPFSLNSGTTVIAEWWSAQDIKLMVNDGSGLISNWKSRVSGLAITATTTARATYNATSFNSSYPGMTFDGSANCYVTTTLSTLPVGSAAGSLVIVGQSITTVTTTTLINYGLVPGSATARSLRKNSLDKFSTFDGSTTGGGSSGTIVTGSGHILYGDFSGTAMNGFADGVACSGNPNTIATLNTGTTRLRIGATNAGTAGGFWTGVMSDALVLNGVLSTSDRQKMEGFFAWNRGLVSVLPAGHPYLGAPP